jgi:hypothetical protein
MVQAILEHPTDAQARLEALRMRVAQTLDDTDSARETGTLARVLLDVEAALRSLAGDAAPTATPVDELLAKRAARGAK